MNKKILLLIAALVMIVSINTAFAVPILQLYVEGAAYDSASQSWVNGSPEFILWVLGDVEAKGKISDVQLVTSFLTEETGTISITPTTATTGQSYSVGDPSTPSFVDIRNPTGSGEETAPTMIDGSALPNHGQYGPGRSWNTYSIGHFELLDSPIGDYNGAIATTFPDMGQINAYKISITGYSEMHFDAFDHIACNNKVGYKSKFAPFSHDADWTPEPSTFVLFGMGLLGLVGLKRKKS